MIEVREAAQRSCTREEGRTTWHSFSFGAHYDPRNVGFARLAAHNDERLPPGTGYADHPHADVEVVSWVVSGSLRHASTVGSGVLGPGSVQRLSAGSGVVHSEVDDQTAGGTRFVQAWVRPDESDLDPSWVHEPVDLGEGWTCVADGRGAGLVPIAARGASLHVADLADGQRLELPDLPRLHAFVVAGLRAEQEGRDEPDRSAGVMLGERRLVDGDVARLLDEGGRSVTGVGSAQLVVWGFDAP
ncbi:hypothetical protein SAMN04488570_2993 [Nocardioides scoriae]|uniref:Pirin N-terminal domain-containing protein n=1 Tax=Nocardioides scoriae TaxID=642780 RepID=A0A1H1W1E4_9ACTN|nr:pirin family protein [Nocardioides scoriae]SDS90336.1 hypothetical protein SAMN04488570_2993 [Nocardioides scoriae]